MATQTQSCSQSGAAAGSIEVSEKAFGREFNEALVHQVVTAYMAAGRAGTKAQKTPRRSARRRQEAVEPEGYGGRARAGSIRSPIWVGGGRAFAARPRDFTQKVNRKMYRGAMRSMLSELVRQDRLVGRRVARARGAEDASCSRRSSRSSASTDVLILVEAYDEKLDLAARNLPRRGRAAGRPRSIR